MGGSSDPGGGSCYRGTGGEPNAEGGSTSPTNTGGLPAPIRVLPARSGSRLLLMAQGRQPQFKVVTDHPSPSSLRVSAHESARSEFTPPLTLSPPHRAHCARCSPLAL